MTAAFAADLNAERVARNGGPPSSAWLQSATQLLQEPDPGPTPYAVDQLLVAGAIVALQGSHKAGKTWLLLELAIAIVTGRPALGRFAVPTPGPVILVLEESGRDALHRRLDALRRGAGLRPQDLADLHFAANRRVRLDDPAWRQKLIDAGSAIGPTAILLDPLVRLKGASVDEDSQKEMAPVLDFMRDLRDATGAAVAFAHHTGHQGGRLRGTSDLEAYWETKLSLARETDGICELTAEHREAEATPALRYRLAWHDPSRTMRLAPLEDATPGPDPLDELAAHVTANPGQSADDIAKAIRRKKADTLQRLRELEARGRLCTRPAKRPGTGRAYEAWHPGAATESLVFPGAGNTREHGNTGTGADVPDPPAPRRGGGRGTPAAPTIDAELERLSAKGWQL